MSPSCRRAGEIVLFDRSWYNRAVVEPVMGFSTPEQTDRFLDDVPVFEKMLVDNGIHLVKLWLTIGREMQIKRLFDRRHDPLKRWKLSAIDYKGLPLWDAYTEAAGRMLERHPYRSRAVDRDPRQRQEARAAGGDPFHSRRDRLCGEGQACRWAGGPEDRRGCGNIPEAGRRDLNAALMVTGYLP